jgi:hypothetical protein
VAMNLDDKKRYKAWRETLMLKICDIRVQE